LSGATGLRGYLVQALIGLLDALKDDEWVSVTLEPDVVSEKIDLLWHYENGATRACQVKSSQNQISLPDAKRWALDLKVATKADAYELQLLGNVSETLGKEKEIEGVAVSTTPLDVVGLIERAAHRIDRFLERNKLSSGNADYREQLVLTLIGKLEVLSVESRSLTQRDLVETLVGWVKSMVSGRGRWELILRAELSQIEPIKDVVIESLRETSGDVELQFKQVDTGSVVFGVYGLISAASLFKETMKRRDNVLEVGDRRFDVDNVAIEVRVLALNAYYFLPAVYWKNSFEFIFTSGIYRAFDVFVAQGVACLWATAMAFDLDIYSNIFWPDVDLFELFADKRLGDCNRELIIISDESIYSSNDERCQDLLVRDILRKARYGEAFRWRWPERLVEEQAPMRILAVSPSPDVIDAPKFLGEDDRKQFMGVLGYQRYSYVNVEIERHRKVDSSDLDAMSRFIGYSD